MNLSDTDDRIVRKYLQPLMEQIHLTPSITFPNLQQPENNSRILGQLESSYHGTFKWAGEINVYKHALGTVFLSFSNILINSDINGNWDIII